MPSSERPTPQEILARDLAGGELPPLAALERHVLREDLIEFIREAWPIVEPGTVYKPNWHIDCVADHLTAVTNGEIRNLIINVPPRHMKSLTVGVFWPAWAWTFWPESRWMFASYAGDLAIRDNLKSRRVMQSLWFQQRWPEVQFAPDQNLKQRFENTLTGFRQATSPGGMGTGEGGDFVVADDPHSVAQAESDDVRDGTVNWWRETMSTRLNDPSTGRKVIVMQRVHGKDVVGYAMETGDYHHLCLPARFEPRVLVQPGTPPKPQPHDAEACDLDAAAFPHRLDPRARDGDLLWEGHFTPEALAVLERALGPYGTAGQLQQRPVPRGGAIFKEGSFKPFPPDFDVVDAITGHTRRSRLIRIAYVDLAWGTKKSNDYTVILTIGWEKATGNAYVLHVDRFRASDAEDAEGLDRLDLRIAANVAIQHQHILILEEGAFQQAPTRALLGRLSRHLVAKKLVVSVGTIAPVTDKETRAQLPAGWGLAGNLFADHNAPWWAVFLAECLSFPRGEHDDQVDGLSGALQGAIEHAGLVDQPASVGYRPQGGSAADVADEESPFPDRKRADYVVRR